MGDCWGSAESDEKINVNAKTILGSLPSEEINL
jgi:hypothetical protein